MKTALTISAIALASATAAHAQDIAQAENTWFIEGQAAVEAALANPQITGTAKNVIILIADGNGVGTNYATRLYTGQLKGGYGDEYVQPHEAFANVALVKTYNVNAQTPDSAGTGTAMMTGVKTKAGVIGVDGTVPRGDCLGMAGHELTTVNEVMAAMGKSTGIVSTARITHATPASAYAKTMDRDFEYAVPETCAGIQEDIASQLIAQMQNGVIDVALGGGRRNFIGKDITDEEGGTGKRPGAENLIEEAAGFGAYYAWNDETLAAAPMDGTPILGLFEASHMQYEADRAGEPSLAEMTAAAIKALSTNENGFFLQVEGGRVDHANHAGNLARTVADGLAFADAVAIADELTNDEDTLIIVTADHEHALAFQGYAGRGSDILGLSTGIDEAGIETTGIPNLADDGMPYTTAGYLNGPGSVLRGDMNWVGVRPELTQEEVTDIDYLQQALIPFSSESHSGEDVAVFAKGPWAHLFGGVIEQNMIFHVMNYAATAK